MELLDAGAPLDMQDEVSEEKIEWVYLFINISFPLSFSSQLGNTALHYAAINGHYSIVQMLMSADCRINVHNKDGSTPMDIAQSLGHTDIVTLLTGLKVIK